MVSRRSKCRSPPTLVPAASSAASPQSTKAVPDLLARTLMQNVDNVMALASRRRYPGSTRGPHGATTITTIAVKLPTAKPSMWQIVTTYLEIGRDAQANDPVLPMAGYIVEWEMAAGNSRPHFSTHRGLTPWVVWRREDTEKLCHFSLVCPADRESPPRSPLLAQDR